jgi:carbon-monoxide dehydrogenase medium subunit
MKAAPFAYERARSVAEALSSLRLGDAIVKPFGGGQSLGPMLNLRLARPDRLIDVSAIPEIRESRRQADHFRIGGAVTHAEIEDGELDDLLQESPSVARMLRHVAGTIAYRAVRNRGTLAGSLAHADPAADWVLTMTVLDAQLQCAHAGGQRVVAMTQFMTGAFSTALNEGELLTGVLLPRYSAAMRWGYYKFCRKTGEFAEASCAAVFDPERAIARIAIGALDGAPCLLQQLAADVARHGIDALSDAAVHEAVAHAAPAKDEAGRQLIVAAVKRCTRQAWGTS